MGLLNKIVGSDRSFTPTTELELERWMEQNCYNFNSYSIGRHRNYEGFRIEKEQDLFHWYFTERGKDYIIKTCNSERELVEYAFQEIKSDQWAKAHMIAFTKDISEINRLCKQLENNNIKYIQNDIPNYKDGKTAYRIFVFGCDIKKIQL